MIPDYIIIPAEKSGSSQLELLVADPQEGFHLLVQEEDFDSNYARHFTDLQEFNQDEDVQLDSLGKIERFALSANKKLLAIYSNTDQGDLIVLKSDLTKELNRLRTGMVGAENLIWCGNDTTVMEFIDKVIMVGPQGEC